MLNSRTLADLATRSGARRIDTSLIHRAGPGGSARRSAGSYHGRRERRTGCVCRGVGPRRVAACGEARRSGDAGRRLDHDGRPPAGLQGGGLTFLAEVESERADAHSHDGRDRRRRSVRSGPHRRGAGAPCVDYVLVGGIAAQAHGATRLDERPRLRAAVDNREPSTPRRGDARARRALRVGG